MWHLSYVMLGHCLIKAQFQKRWDIKQNIKETECEDLLILFDKQSIKNSTNTISWMFYILNNFWKDTLTGNLMPVTCFKHTRTRTHTFFFCSAPLLILYSCCCFHSMYWTDDLPGLVGNATSVKLPNLRVLIELTENTLFLCVYCSLRRWESDKLRNAGRRHAELLRNAPLWYFICWYN